MTDRVKGFTVTLEKDIRIDDVEHIVNAVRMIKGVSAVELSVTNPDDLINRGRIEREVKINLHNYINNGLFK